MLRVFFKKRMRRLFVILFIVIYSLSTEARGNCINHWETVIYAGDDWRYVVDSAFQDQDWKFVSYNDALWDEGKGGIGYGDNDDGTIVPTCKILYLRKKFLVKDPVDICEALLSIDYDDGFVAWLNGGEIARSGVTGMYPDANSPVVNHEAKMYAGGHPENFMIHEDTLAKYLKQGENELSLQIHNQALNSSDLSSIIYFSVAVSSSDQLYRPLADEIIMPV